MVLFVGYLVPSSNIQLQSKGAIAEFMFKPSALEVRSGVVEVPSNESGGY